MNTPLEDLKNRSQSRSGLTGSLPDPVRTKRISALSLGMHDGKKRFKFFEEGSC
jgi:hypothetical protein